MPTRSLPVEASSDRTAAEGFMAQDDSTSAQRWYQSRFRRARLSSAADGGLDKTDSVAQAGSSTPALSTDCTGSGLRTNCAGSALSVDCTASAPPADCTPRNGNRSSSSPRLTTIPPGSKAYRTTPSTICWPSTNRVAGRSLTEISAALDAGAIMTPLTVKLSVLVAAWGAGPLPTAGAGGIITERPEKEGTPDSLAASATGAGEESTGDCEK